MSFECKNIKEVWNYRLSRAVPTVYNRKGENWRVEIHSKGESNAVLAEFDTGIKATPEDNWNKEALQSCYTWLKSVRDSFAYKNIEEMKAACLEAEKLEEEYSKSVAGLSNSDAILDKTAILALEKMRRFKMPEGVE